MELNSQMPEQPLSPDQGTLCHLPEECEAAYRAIPEEAKTPALAALKDALTPVEADIRLAHQARPSDWWKGHTLMGIALRNLLRSKGFGEEYFGVHNLDDIYVYLIQDALGLI
jgi:hypothetical protein